MPSHSMPAAGPSAATRPIAIAVAGLALMAVAGTDAGAVEWPAALKAIGADAWAGDLGAAIRRGYTREPAAMAGVAASAVVPLVWLSVATVRGVSRLGRWAAGRSGREAEVTDAGPMACLGKEAWIVVWDMGGEARPLAIGELTRIGSDEDCELALAGAGLAETHALVQRTEEGSFVVIDVSGDDTAGVAINGERVLRGELSNGDTIEVGERRLVFQQGTRLQQGGAGEAMPASSWREVA